MWTLHHSPQHPLPQWVFLPPPTNQHLRQIEIGSAHDLMAIRPEDFEQEARAYAIDFPATGARLKQLEEGIQVIRSLWTNEYSTFHGQHYHLDNARCDPKPVQRPTPTI